MGLRLLSEVVGPFTADRRPPTADPQIAGLPSQVSWTDRQIDGPVRIAFEPEGQDNSRVVRELGWQRMVLTAPVVVIAVVLIATVASSGLAVIAILAGAMTVCTGLLVGYELWLRRPRDD
jgi:hypothetical protein